ncbi:MAG: hypothetical protein II999_09250 [Bacteroidaceae bacterium]|nr:hypothetical protein [Bacteroidaceae bacterium]
MEKVLMYEAPQVEVIEVAVEKGFASSGFEIQVTDEKAIKSDDDKWWAL